MDCYMLLPIFSTNLTGLPQCKRWCSYIKEHKEIAVIPVYCIGLVMLLKAEWLVKWNYFAKPTLAQV